MPRHPRRPGQNRHGLPGTTPAVWADVTSPRPEPRPIEARRCTYCGAVFYPPRRSSPRQTCRDWACERKHISKRVREHLAANPRRPRYTYLWCPMKAWFLWESGVSMSQLATKTRRVYAYGEVRRLSRLGRVPPMTPRRRPPQGK